MEVTRRRHFATPGFRAPTPSSPAGVLTGAGRHSTRLVRFGLAMSLAAGIASTVVACQKDDAHRTTKNEAPASPSEQEGSDQATGKKPKEPKKTGESAKTGGGSSKSQPAAEPAFEVTESVVKTAFLALGPDIDRGLGFQSHKIVLGDLNGDDKIDAVVDYSLAVEKGNTGNMGSAFSGLVAFVNTGKKLMVADHTEKFSDFGNTAKSVSAIKSGVIVLEGLDQGPEDARCCPSIHTKVRLVLRAGKLTKLE